MKIQYRIGDLITAPEIAIAHGVNCMGAFNAGVAKSIREAYPQAYENYLKQLKDYKENYKRSPLGTTAWLIINPDRVIINCYSQEYYGNDGKRYVDYDALYRCFQNIDSMCFNSQLENGFLHLYPKSIREVAFPKIGAGLAGGDWEEISDMLEYASDHFQPIVYVLSEDEIP